MTADGGDDALIRAMGLLEECDRRLWDYADTGDGIAGLIAEARRRYDEVERASASGDGETAATLAIGRSMAAALELRLCIDGDADLNSGWDWEWDGPPLGGMSEEDGEGVSAPFARQAAEAARAALDADPDDPMAPFDLGQALAWSGDRDGAVAAYAEALRRDPWDEAAWSRLDRLGAEPGEQPPDDPVNRRRHGFALLYHEERLGDFEWSDGSRVYGNVAEACADADAMIAEGIGDLARDEFRGMLKLVLEIHRPGLPIAEHDLIARIPAEVDGPVAIDWSGIPVGEPLEPPLPPGRPLRMDAKTCFHGAGQGRAGEE